MQDQKYINQAIELARSGMKADEGGPFGAVIVNQDGDVIGKGNNKVTSTNDPTAHAEVVAIRDACQNTDNYQLDGCTIYTSCEPCPMCLGAIYWARPARIVYACSREDAMKVGFDDDHIYKEIALPMAERKIPTEQIARDESVTVFQEWQAKMDKLSY